MFTTTKTNRYRKKRMTSNKRIHREIETLRRIGYICDVTLIQEKRSNVDLSTTLLCFRTAKNNLVCIQFDHRSYPFHAPTITINDQSYSLFFACKSPKIIHAMRKLISWNENFCLCCQTILCNWSPVNNVEHILQEIDRYNLIKRNIVYKLFYDEMETLSKKGRSDVAIFHQLPNDLLKYIFTFLVEPQFALLFYK